MTPIRCPYCEELSPAGARFCSACGGALHLAPCPHCGAVNDVTAAACYQCNRQLAGHSADVPDAVLPATETGKRRRFGYPQVGVVIAIVAAIGALAYLGHPKRLPVDAPGPAGSPTGEASGRGIPADSGVIRRDTGAADIAPAKGDIADAKSAEPTGSPAMAAAIRPTSAATSQSRAERETVESPKPKPAATSGAQTGRARKAEQGSAPSPVACTEQVAALGLCPPESVQKKDVNAATVSKAPAPGPQSIGGSNAAGQVATPQQACTEAVAALGLCTPEPTQRRE